MSGITRRTLGVYAMGAALIGATRRAAAQGAWPSRPVTVVVPFPAGGGTDVLARAISRHFSEIFGQPFIVDNRTGAGGNIGAGFVAKAAPDGYTLLFTTNGPVTNNTLLYRNLTFNPVTDLSPVAPIAELPAIIVTRPQMPYRNIPELIAYARANPRKVNCGVPGAGTLGHLVSELLQHRTGVRFTVVPYRGSAPLTNDLLSGAVDVAVDLVTTYLPHLQAGTTRALAITSAEKLPQLPDIQPVQSQGVPDFKATGWATIMVPARTPSEIIGKLHGAAQAYLGLESTRVLFPTLGMSPLGGTPADVSRMMRDELALWRPVVEAAGITLE
jgi:tripartite-type tricarboxylate transporter receptor subunit TctC